MTVSERRSHKYIDASLKNVQAKNAWKNHIIGTNDTFAMTRSTISSNRHRLAFCASISIQPEIGNDYKLLSLRRGPCIHTLPHHRPNTHDKRHPILPDSILYKI